jgi:hypothetical protein
LLTLAFGAFFLDYDLDGWLDIFTANGHIEEEIGRVQPKVSFSQRPHLFRNLGRGRFEEVTARTGAALQKAVVARGAAHGDFDRDGDPDLLITTNNGPAYLLRNDGGNKNNWLSVRLKGVKSNRNGLGARITVESASGTQWQIVRSGSSYCSASDLALIFGLAKDAAAIVTVDWPSGLKQQLTGVKPNQHLIIEEK